MMQLHQSIKQTKHIYIAPCVANDSDRIRS